MEWLTIARLRYRKLVGERGRHVVIALLVVGVLSAGVGLAAATSPPTETVREPTDTIVVSTTSTTAATVSGETELYDRGEVVRDSPVYLTDAAPNFSVTVGISTRDDRPLDVDQRLTLVYEAMDGDETFWRRQEIVARSSQAVEEGNATVTATLNASEILAEQQMLEAETGRRATVRVTLVHSASYTTGEYEGGFSNGAGISVSGQTYSVGDGIADDDTHLERRTVTRPVASKTYDVSVLGAAHPVPKRSIWFGIAAVACWLVAGHAAVLEYRRPDLDEIDRELAHRRFDSWISRGRVPDEMGTRIPVSSLADLVDVAIDANSRVVYDPTRELYIVLADDVTYTHGPETTVRDAWDDVVAEGTREDGFDWDDEDDEFEWNDTARTETESKP